MTASNFTLPDNVLDLLLDAVCVVDEQGIFLSISAAGERIFGYRSDEMIGKPMIDFVLPEDRERTLAAAAEINHGRLFPCFENRYLHKNGQAVHIMWSARWSAEDRVRVAVARDISERKHADAIRAALYAISEAAHVEDDFAALFRRIHEIVLAFLPVSAFTVALFDDSTDTLSFPYHIDACQPVPDTSDAARLARRVMSSGEVQLAPIDATPDELVALTFGVPLIAKSGTLGALVIKREVVHTRSDDKDFELLQFISAQIASAIERKQMEVRLQHLARHDSLTGLPNRALFHDRLQTALRLAERNAAQLSLLYIDVDRFKEVNDTLGHDVGDRLLQEIARRLTQSIRESDTVGRLGGDEFVILLNNTALSAHAAQVAETIRVALNQPYELGEHRVHVSPSIGVAHYPEHGADYEVLLRHADQAMYGAKRKGGNQFQLGAGSRPHGPADDVPQ
ncbi:MAG TPA: diguanylate cyclase [Thiobacillus sp.]